MSLSDMSIIDMSKTDMSPDDIIITNQTVVVNTYFKNFQMVVIVQLMNNISY